MSSASTTAIADQLLAFLAHWNLNMAQNMGGSQSMPMEDETSNPIPDSSSTPHNASEEVSHASNENVIAGKETSFVWNHFTKIFINGGVKAKCNYCSRMLYGNSKFGTSHLHNHYKTCNKRKHHDVHQKIITKNVPMKGESQKLVIYTFNEKTTRRKLVNAIILHEYPLCMVDHLGF